MKITRGTGSGDYDVWVDGEVVGCVWKTIERYNIAPRSVTVTSWRFSPINGPADRTLHSTRRDAVAALIKQTQELEH